MSVLDIVVVAVVVLYAVGSLGLVIWDIRECKRLGIRFSSGFGND